MIAAETVFGPVRSRRLGWSLGVDPLPFGLCTYDCVYCQLGRTRARSLGARMTWAPESILDEVDRALTRVGREALDWITIVGAGEPTLYAGLGPLIRGLKAMSGIRVAVISNGSLLHLAEVREALGPADAVLPSLDAADDPCFRAVNRPHPDLDLRQVLEGLVAFRGSYRGSLQVEVMLVDGVNDGDGALENLAAALHRVQPDEVHVGVPTRPPAEPWVRPPPEDRVQRAIARLGGQTAPLPARLSAKEPPCVASRALPEALAAIIRRHPMTVEELARTIGSAERGAVAHALGILERSGTAQRVHRFGLEFWTTSRARFEDAEGGRP